MALKLALFSLSVASALRLRKKVGMVRRLLRVVLRSSNEEMIRRSLSHDDYLL